MFVKSAMGGGRKFGISIAILFYVANLSAADTNNQYVLSEVNVDANATSGKSNDMAISTTDKFQSKTTISRKMIEATPSGNGDITSLLKTNHSVKFSNTNNQSTTLGEIDPADISINGAKYYQNNFMIDGFNMNNDLDPAGSKGYSHSNVNSIWDPISSASQGMSIDSDYIDSIDVYDSDVSAKYGNFTGGVIDAKTRDPLPGFHGKISMSHTRDSWTRYHINDEASINGGSTDDFEDSADATNQPHFKKYSTRLNLEGSLTDSLAMMFGYTNTRSIIPLKTFASTVTNDKFKESKSKQRRNIDNYFLKGVWYATDRLTITPSIIYAPQKAKVYRRNAKDSFMDQRSGGITALLKVDYEFDFMRVNQQLGYSKLETSRDSENQYSLTWKYSNIKNWGPINGNSSEGAFGNIEQIQKTLNYNIDFDFDEVDLLWTTHKFITGAEIKKQEAYYSIPEEFVAAGQPKTLNNNNCLASDPYCSKDSSFNGKGQYLSLLQTYGPGKISVDATSWAYYLEDKITIGDLTLRPGVRFSGDDYMDKKTVAPRFSTDYDVFGDDSTIVSFGKNRYYGRNIFKYILDDGKHSLVKYSRRSSPNSAFMPYGGLANDIKFSQLKIPYDDETSYGFIHKFLGMELDFKYIKRKGRDQIIKTAASRVGVTCGNGYTTRCSTYSNKGYSDTKAWKIGIKNEEPLKILSTRHTFEIAYDHFSQKTNSNTYANSLDSDEMNGDKIVYYNGRLMNYYDLPVGDYSSPWTVTFTTVSQIPQANLTVSNFLTFKGRTEVTARNGNIIVDGTSYERYDMVDLGKKYTWDSRIAYQHKLPKNVTAFVNLDITNILDRKNKAAQTSSSSTVVTYQAGRQFWLEAGLKW